MADVLKVFVSATSRDLKSYREAVKQALLDHPDLDILPITQEHFPVTHLEVTEKLREQLGGCDAVICLVGLVYGGEPSSGATRRSYTQMEFDVARDLKKPIYLFFARDDYLPDQQPIDDGEQSELQRIYREQLKRGNQDYSEFGSATEIEKLVRRIRFAGLARPKSKPMNLPYDSLGTLFKGRDSFMKDLHDRLIKDPPKVSGWNAIHGLGGVGKTRAAVECAWRFANEYSALLFVVADSPDNIQRNLASLAGPLVLNLPERDSREEEAKFAAVVRWLEQHPNWFLILDNVDTRDAADAVERMLPRFKSGCVVITTRLTDWSAGVEPLDLDVLAEESAIEFLLDRTARTRRKLASDREDAALLVKHLDGLALALEQAGAFIAKQRISFADYAKRWKEGQERVRTWVDERLMKYPRSVAATWDTTMREIGEGAQTLLRILAWLAPDPLPRLVLEGEKADGEFSKAMETIRGARDETPPMIDDALAELAAYSMVKFDKESGETLTVHRLVQEVVRQRIPREAEKVCVHAAIKLLRIASAGNPDDVRSWPALEPLVPHLASVIQQAERLRLPKPTSQLSNLLGVLLMNKSLFSRAEPLFRLGLRWNENEYGPKHPVVSRDLNNLGQLLRMTNRFADAEPLMRRALAISEANHGAVHEFVAVRLCNLAELMKVTDRIVEAEALYRRALSIYEETLGTEHSNVATALNNLGQLLKTLGRYSEAEKLLRRALAIDEKTYGQDHPKVAIRLSNLAETLRSAGQHHLGEPLARRALVIDERAYGPQHQKVATRLFNLSELLRGTSRFAEGEEAIRRALAIDEATYGSDHPSVARDLKALGRMLYSARRPADGEPFARRAIAIDELSFGADHPAVATGLNGLADILLAQKKPELAEPLLRRALLIDEKSYGAVHPGVARDLINLSEALTDLNRAEEAEPMARRAMAIDEQVHGPEHVSLARDCRTFGKALVALGKLKEGESLLIRSLRTFQRFNEQTGHAHPDMEDAIGDFRNVLEDRGCNRDQIMSAIQSAIRA